MSRPMAYLLSWILLVGGVRAAERNDPTLDLVRNGKARAMIVLGAHPTEAESHAAGELREYIKRVSGAELRMVEEGAESEGMSSDAIIAVGGTKLAKSAGLSVGSSDPEAFRIARRGRVVYLLGRGAPGYGESFKNNLGSGIEYAAYEFLERTCGVRWLRPGPQGTYVPHKKTISVSTIDIEQAPDFQYRFYSYWYEGKAARILGTPFWKQRVDREVAELHEWMKHNKMNGCRVIPGGHAFYRIVPKSEYAEHPDYFALYKGSREPRGAHHGGWQLCTTNPDVIDRAVQYVRERFKAGQIVVSVLPNDGGGFCECERCRALDDPTWKDKRGRVVLSDRIATFVNEVARRVKTDFPDRFVGSEAYSCYAEPPRRVKFESNVMLWLTNRQYFNWVPGCREKFFAFYRKWNSVQPHVFVPSSEFLTYESRWGTPWSILPLDAEVIQWAARQESFKTKSGPSPIQNDWGNNGILYWATARLFWNARQDVNALVDDYCCAMYGKAAAPMRQYWDRLTEGEREWQKGLKEPPRLVNVVFHLPEVYSPSVLADCRTYLDQALPLADTKWARNNVRFTEKGFDYTRMTTEAMDAYLRLLKAKKEKEIVGLTKRMRDVWKRRRVFIEEQRDEHVVGYGQFKLMVLNADKYGSQQSHEQRFAFFGRIQPEKLLNGGLEDDLWGTWYRFQWGPEARWSAEKPHQGKRCISIVRSGSVGQFLALVPGRTYRLKGWVRTDGVKSAGVRLYSFTQPAFMWLYRLAVQKWRMTTPLGKGSIIGTNDWQPVSCQITPRTPEVLIECFNNDTGEAFFDDFTLERVDK
ncbi:MAG: DUF4838 domain-containing protein [Planctomycetes bacterium]|nr:DUF4838 domain-containing protein [Planctomycetota bacterium]